MFSSIGWGEIAIIVVLVLLLFGARKLPDIGHSLGRSIIGFKKGLKETTEDVKSAIKEDVTGDTTTDPTVTSSADKSEKTE